MSATIKTKKQSIKPEIWAADRLHRKHIFMAVRLLVLFLMACPVLIMATELWQADQRNIGFAELHYIKNTIVMVFVAIVSASLMGIPSAFLTVHYNFPFRGFLQWALLMPLAIPSYIQAFILVDVMEPVTSYDFLWSLRMSVLSLIRSEYGGGFVVSLSLFPYVYLLSRLSFMSQSGRIVDVSRMYGFSMWRYFFKGALPLAFPAILSSLVLVVLESLGEYGVPVYFGFQTITTNIFVLWDNYGYTAASVKLSYLMLALVIAILLLEKALGSDRREMLLKFASSSYLPRRITASKLKSCGMMLYCFLPVFLGFLLPVLQLCWMLIWNFDAQIPFESLASQVLNSLALGMIAGMLVVLISLFFLHRAYRFLHLQHFLFGYGYGIPSLVLALGVLMLLTKLDQALVSFFSWEPQQILSGGVLGLLYVYIVRFMRVGFGPIERSFHRIGMGSTMTSRLLGLSWQDKLRYMYFPSMWLSMCSGMMLVMVDVFKELPATQLLRPLGFDTLSTGIYQWGGDELVEKVALGSLLMIALGGIASIFLVRMLMIMEKERNKNEVV